MCYGPFPEPPPRCMLYQLCIRFEATVVVLCSDTCGCTRTCRELFRLTVSNYQAWFETTVIFWLHTFREECIRRTDKALEIDRDVVQVTATVKYSNSSVDVLSCFTKVGKNRDPRSVNRGPLSVHAPACGKFYLHDIPYANKLRNHLHNVFWLRAAVAKIVAASKWFCLTKIMWHCVFCGDKICRSSE